MKKRLLIVLCFCFLLYPLSNGGSEEQKVWELNGYEWTRMSELEQIAFVRGWAEAGQIAFLRLAQFSVRGSPKEKIDPDKIINIFEHMDIARKITEESGLGLGGLVIDQIINIIDKIYSDPRTKNWGTIRVMPIVIGRLKKGWTEKEMDEVIAYYVKRDNHIKNLRNPLTLKDEMEPFDKKNEPDVLKALRAY